MISCEKLPSGKYRTRVYWSDESGKHSKSFTANTKKECKKLAECFDPDSVTVARPVQETKKEMTLGEAIRKYIEIKSNVLSPTTFRSYTSLAEHSLISIQDIPLSEITSPLVQEAMNIEAAHLSPKTVRNINSLFTSAMNVFRPDFTCRVRLPQKIKREARIPTEKEVNAIIGLCGDTETKLFVMLAAYQGLREGEVAGLKWENIDFINDTMTIDESIVRDIKGNYVSKKPKTLAGNRTIVLMPQVKKMLLTEDRDGKYILTHIHQTYYKRYKSILKRLGLNYTFHELRHYACSVMISLGIPNKYIAAMLGHESEVMVQTVYGHIMRDKENIFYDRLKAYYSECEQ